MKIGYVYVYLRSWRWFNYMRIDRDMWQVRVGFLLISRMPNGNYAV